MTQTYRKSLLDILLKKNYLKSLGYFKTSPSFFKVLKSKLAAPEAEHLDKTLAALSLAVNN